MLDFYHDPVALSTLIVYLIWKEQAAVAIRIVGSVTLLLRFSADTYAL
jgi:hypothetical protein